MLFTYSLLIGKCVLKQSALRINFEVHTGVAPLGDFMNILIEVILRTIFILQSVIRVYIYDSLSKSWNHCRGLNWPGLIELFYNIHPY